ncbi:MAG: carbon monoxide dehydrogenase subunit G [Alphaproteobacteria bacterium]|nr:carbon monoxide dehydrogenase subunit G [Alphaproteobacteria bacterium]
MLPATREKVWAALNDPEVLRRCIPGCQAIEKVSDTEFTARVGLAVGPVKATFNGRVTLSDFDPPNGYKISGEGQGGVAGFGKGGAVVKLADEAGATRLTYAADASVGGKLAQIGSRLVEATARKLADEFFTRFAEEFPAAPATVAPVPMPVAAAPAPNAATSSETPAAPNSSATRVSPTIWVPALIAVVAAVYWLSR